MRRRRLIRGPEGTALAKPRPQSDLAWLSGVVTVRHPVRDARTWLARRCANPVRVRLVEAGRGESAGQVRCVEIQHANSGERTWIRAERRLANGQPASFFVPDHLVQLEPVAEGPAARTGLLGQNDVLVLHVPVRGYLRFLPGVFHGSGPVSARKSEASAGTALQRARGSTPTETTEVDVDEEPLRRFLFLFQHVMTTVTDRIDHLAQITDPSQCDPDFLPWLASWVGFALDESLSVHQQRELVQRAIRLYRTRGTRGGIEEMVRVLTSAPLRIRELELPKPMVLGRAHLGGGRDVADRYERGEPSACYLMDVERHRPTGFFALVLEPRGAFRERFGERAGGVLRRIARVVGRERPAHVMFTIRFDESR